MRKPAVMMALFVLVAGLAAAQENDEIDWVGTWRVYHAEGMSGYSLSDHENGALEQQPEGELVLEADGELEHTLDDFPYDNWRFEDGFLVFERNGSNGFYAVRTLSPDVLYLVNVTVTERNREVIRIRTNRRYNMLVLRD